MIEKIKALCVKHREILVYLIVGGMTTLVSWGCKFLWGAIFYPGVAHPSVGQTTVLNVVENLSGILFAYYPNRRWVFQSKNPRILEEFGGFFVSRLGTWGLSLVLNLLLTNGLNVEYHIATVLVAVVVIIGNYVISKFLIFRKKKDGEESPAETEE
ncbi:MAG: GtrA family protein [Oscillospiraceae bacterium]|nr:GtrA family protein [Oscillospiraceae bacterium]